MSQRAAARLQTSQGLCFAFSFAKGILKMPSQPFLGLSFHLARRLESRLHSGGGSVLLVRTELQ